MGSYRDDEDLYMDRKKETLTMAKTLIKYTIEVEVDESVEGQAALDDISAAIHDFVNDELNEDFGESAAITIIESE
jgi:hypothetical protein